MSDATQFRPEDMQPHVDSRTCGRCRKPLTKGQRIMQAHIVEGPSVNPQNLGQTGLMLTGEYELVHIDCRDPYLKRGLLP